MAILGLKMQRVVIRNLVLLLFVVALPIAGQERSAVWHQITGTVVDEQEQPVKGARVCAEGTLPSGGALPCGESNANGQFSINVERLDTYTLYAQKLDKGYPNASWAFYGKLWHNVPRVTIDETSTPAPVKIKLGPKAGRLVLTILDGSTNKPIEGGVVELCRLGEPLSWWSISTSWPKGHYEILTPEVPFTMKFQTWHGEWVDRKAFDESGVQIETVKLDLGERLEMTIRLN